MIGGQMPSRHWGDWRLDSHDILFTATGPFSVNIVKCSATEHVEDEQGVGANDPVYTSRCVVVGQLDNGIVLWWAQGRVEWLRDEKYVIQQQGDCVDIYGKLVHIFTGEGSEC